MNIYPGSKSYMKHIHSSYKKIHLGNWKFHVYPNTRYCTYFLPNSSCENGWSS